MKLEHLGSLAFLLAVALLLGGCATSKLWEADQLARFHEPAMPSNLRLFQSNVSTDVLVEYDEWRDGDETPRRRAYWLEQTARSQARRKPIFVATGQTSTLSAIPIIESASLRADGRIGMPYAFMSTNGQTFALYSAGKAISHDLPVYEDASGRIKQIALTPLTVAADLTIFGGYLFVWVWSSGGLNSVH